jgi:hypothetical protein
MGYLGSYLGSNVGAYLGSVGEVEGAAFDAYDALAYTTFERIRTKQIYLIQSLTPTILAGQPFRIHQDPMSFMRWVTASPRGCFRRFEILQNFDYEFSETASSYRSARHTFDLRVGYPLELGLYGAGNEMTLRDLIASDATQLEGCIGRHGFLNFRAAHEVCERQEQNVLELEGARVLSIRFLVQYDTLAGGVA